MGLFPFVDFQRCHCNMMTSSLSEAQTPYVDSILVNGNSVPRRPNLKKKKHQNRKSKGGCFIISIYPLALDLWTHRPQPGPKPQAEGLGELHGEHAGGRQRGDQRAQLRWSHGCGCEGGLDGGWVSHG